MKTKKNMITVALFLICYSSFGQFNSFSLSGGITKNGTSYDFSYAKRINTSEYYVLGLSYYDAGIKTPFDNVPVKTYYLSGGYKRDILSSRSDDYSVFLGLNGFLGRETINNGNKTTSSGGGVNNPNVFIYGAAVFNENSFYINRSISLVLKNKIIYNIPSDIRNLNYSITLGITYQL
jgi:hypothetical protein